MIQYTSKKEGYYKRNNKTIIRKVVRNLEKIKCTNTPGLTGAKITTPQEQSSALINICVEQCPVISVPYPT